MKIRIELGARELQFVSRCAACAAEFPHAVEVPPQYAGMVGMIAVGVQKALPNGIEIDAPGEYLCPECGPKLIAAVALDTYDAPDQLPLLESETHGNAN